MAWFGPVPIIQTIPAYNFLDFYAVIKIYLYVSYVPIAEELRLPKRLGARNLLAPLVRNITEWTLFLLLLYTARYFNKQT